MSHLQEVVDCVTAAGLALHKTIPRGHDHLLLELRDPQGALVAGQWYLDREQSAMVAQRIREMCGADTVAELDGTGIVLQRRGADRRLPTLHEIASSPGAELVSHRAERRGVVRAPNATYTKVVRRRQVGKVARGLTRSEVQSFAVPAVIGVDTARGTVTTSALPGRTLYDRLGDGSLTDAEVAGDLRRIGAALHDFHAESEREPVAAHDARAELATTERWLSTASEYGVIPAGSWHASWARAATLLAWPPAPATAVHPNLHDKQLVLSDGAQVGLLDLDLSTTGEPAVDLANLLVHLEVRALQGHCRESRSEVCRLALLDGYAADSLVLQRLPGYLLCTRLRLAGVYAFRNSPPELLTALLKGGES